MNWKFDQQSICGQVARQKAAFLNIELWIVRYRSITTYKTQIGKSISIGLMEYSEYGKQGLDWLMGDITWHAHIDIVAWTNNSSHKLEIKWAPMSCSFCVKCIKSLESHKSHLFFSFQTEKLIRLCARTSKFYLKRNP